PYPSPVEYLGRTMCMEPMSHQQFESFATAIYKLSGDANRMHGLRSNVVGKCASVGQVMRFATLLQSESLRLEFLKAMYPSIYDIDQYNHAEYLFTLNNL